MTIDDILNFYSSEDILRLKTNAALAAVDCGRSGDRKFSLDDRDRDLLDEIADFVWDSDMNIDSKIKLGFELYEIFPDYFRFLNPFYYLIRDKKIESQNQKNVIWKKFMEYLGDEPHLADPVAYVLWVEFFEDGKTVNEAWQGLTNYKQNKNALLRLLEAAGPVPYDLKEPHYNLLIKDKENHNAIFNSLLGSAFDAYGNINARRAALIFSKLKVDPNTETYKAVAKKIKSLIK